MPEQKRIDQAHTDAHEPNDEQERAVLDRAAKLEQSEILLPGALLNADLSEAAFRLIVSKVLRRDVRLRLLHFVPSAKAIAVVLLVLEAFAFELGVFAASDLVDLGFERLRHRFQRYLLALAVVKLKLGRYDQGAAHQHGIYGEADRVVSFVGPGFAARVVRERLGLV